MEWLNLHTSSLDSEAFVGADPVDRATWLCLLRYCAGQENGGRIDHCEGWSDRKWQQTVRVTLKEVLRECGLWKWSEGGLQVTFYPTRKEEEVKRKRLGGLATVAKRWGANRVADSSPDSSAISLPDNSAYTEGKGREGKEREGEEEATSLAHLPSLQEVREWASLSAVPVEYAETLHARFTEDHCWLKHGRLVDWRRKWVRFWASDRASWTPPKKPAPIFDPQKNPPPAALFDGMADKAAQLA
jgi:hypothetical protein